MSNGMYPRHLFACLKVQRSSGAVVGLVCSAAHSSSEAQRVASPAQHLARGPSARRIALAVVRHIMRAGPARSMASVFEHRDSTRELDTLALTIEAAYTTVSLEESCQSSRSSTTQETQELRHELVGNVGLRLMSGAHGSIYSNQSQGSPNGIFCRKIIIEGQGCSKSNQAPSCPHFSKTK